MGNETDYAYDPQGNLTSITAPPPSTGASSSVTSFTYDSTYGSSGLGELTDIHDPLSNDTHITYTTSSDTPAPAGLVKTITDAQSNVTTFAYDARGNRTSMIDP